MKSMKEEKDKEKEKDKSDAEKEGQEASGLKTAGPEGEITAGLSVYSMLCFFVKQLLFLGFLSVFLIFGGLGLSAVIKFELLHCSDVNLLENDQVFIR